MSTKKNKESVQRLHEVTNKRKWDAAPELFTADYVFHSQPEAKGPEGFKQTMSGMAAAFPDYRETIHNIIAEGDMVAVTYTLEGTFTGEMPGVKPTGKKFSLPAVVVCRFKDGKQVEAWPYYDSLSWYQQAGIPLPKE
jgi:steroid delta-isomerase-like uncharacterized protein